MVMVSIGLSYYLGCNKRSAHAKYSTLKLAAVITELALVMQILITAVYWTLLHEGAMQKIAVHKDSIMNFVMFHIHWFPMVSISITVTLSKTIFIYNHAQYVAKFGILYMIINAFGTWQRG